MSGGPPVADDRERYRTLLEINNALVSKLTRESLFAAIARALRRVLPFERTAIFLRDEARHVLRLYILESSLPSSYFSVGLELSADDSHVGRVVSERKPLLRRDLALERAYPAEELAYRDGVRSYAIVPLTARGGSVGALAVASTTPDQYTDVDVAFLQDVAGQVALAVENMTAYEQIAALKARLEHENVYLQEEIRRDHNFVEMIGNSPALLAVLATVEQVAPTGSTVLISGETGTGKELIARAIHGRSTRRERALVKVDCAAISAGLVESELFGHAKGAFTGAIERRVGRFELADRGTIFLDEIGELPLEVQAKLLRVLQDRQFEPVGSNHTVRVDVRVIAATNRDLREAVRAGRFRADLFYRLNVVPIDVPPLRDRREDVPQLVMFFLAQSSVKCGKRIEGVSPSAMERLVAYPWPGNVRELQNVIERGVVLCQGATLDLDRDLLPVARAATVETPVAAAHDGATPRRERGEDGAPLATLQELERRHIQAVLTTTGGVIEGPRGAARILGLHPNTLRSRMVRLRITRAGHGSV